MSLVALSALLVILRIHFPSLPKDGRSPLRTKMDYKVEMLAVGSFHYFDIVNALGKVFRRMGSFFPDRHVFKLQLNFDGHPLCKSSSVQFWPILGMLPRLSKKPVVIGLFCGTTKPKALSDFLKHLVNELRRLSAGFALQGKTCYVTSVMCDAPARVLIPILDTTAVTGASRKEYTQSTA